MGKGKQVRRQKRIAIIRRNLEFAEFLAQGTKECHEGLTFHGTREHLSVWYATPFLMTRDADAREESNFTVIRADLEARFGESFDAHHFGHFAYGWYDRLYVRADDPLAILAVEEWYDHIQHEGIASDTHYDETKWNHDHPNDRECYSEDHECPCEVSQHERNSCARAFIDSGDSPDDDGEWYCETCGDWYAVNADDIAVAELEQYRADCAEQERNGQACLPV
jgi:hypothetical protein